jgi:hypothetical protein
MSNQAQIKPRAEFELQLRFLADSGEISRTACQTNITLYGYGPNPSGQPNLRMLVPTAVRNLLPSITKAGFTPPNDDDIAGLEWPTAANPVFKLTLVPQTSNYASRLEALYQQAQRRGQIVGATCLLPPALLPNW